MPFRGVTVDELRREFVVLASQDGVNFSEVCRRFGISRTHGYALVKRAEVEGLAGMDRRSRRPHTSPQQTPPEIEAEIVALRLAHPDWGARKIGARLRAGGRPSPADSTITTILHRHGLVVPSAGAARAVHRFTHAAPNDLWQMDFLGHKPLRRNRVHPLTILDDHSRFGLTLAACANQSGETVWTHLHRCFERYGLPWAILTDNGPPWGHSGFALTTFDIRLMQLGIRLVHGRPFHPQTQGKVERWHRTITQAVFGPIPYADLAEVQQAFDRFLASYNMERPHEALDQDVPITHYQVSPRPYPHRIAPPAYGDDLDVRKVRQSGEIHYQGARYRISEALCGEWVGLQPTHIDALVEVYYYNQLIRTIHLKADKV